MNGLQLPPRRVLEKAVDAEDRRNAEVVSVARIETPLGPMIAGATSGSIVLLEFADRRMLPTQFRRLARALGCVFTPGENSTLAELRRQLAQYFNGERRRFDLPVSAPGSAFQTGVWRELQRIEPGETRSYAQIAWAIGRPSAVRAVARANGDNRLAIIIPCHRVVGSDGSLTGYGGGLWRKQRLLELEGRTFGLPSAYKE